MKIRSVFENFSPYSWELSNKEIAEIVGIPDDSIIRLDTNTSPFIPERWLNKLAKELVKLPVNQYPDTKYTTITDALSKYCNVNVDNIIMTNGADEAIDIVVKTFIDYNDKFIISTPTYSMFRIAAEILGGKAVEVKRKGDPLFADDIDEIIRVGKKEKASAVFLCNPNNPTGNSIKINELRKLAKELNCGIIVDEAYYEFSGKSVIELIADHPNVIIIRTLSKAFSLAGARIGYIVANKDTVNKLNYVRPPNSLSVISLKLGTIALSDIQQMKDWTKKIVSERKRCYAVLESINGIKPYTTEANFIPFKLTEKRASYVHKRLMEKGVVVRNLSEVKGLENCLRFTISTKVNNDRFLTELKNILKNSS